MNLTPFILTWLLEKNENQVSGGTSNGLPLRSGESHFLHGHMLRLGHVTDTSGRVRPPTTEGCRGNNPKNR